MARKLKAGLVMSVREHMCVVDCQDALAERPELVFVCVRNCKMASRARARVPSNRDQRTSVCLMIVLPEQAGEA